MEERRESKDRRSGKERRTLDLANYSGTERRHFKHRRIVAERRKATMLPTEAMK